MSGQGCRVFEEFGHGDYSKIFDEYFAESDNTNITRLDAAFDDQDDLIDFQRLCEDTKNEEFISRWRKGLVEFGWPRKSEGNTIYWGSKKSDFFARVYDKAKERGYDDGRHWIRFELQMRDEKAVEYLKTTYEPKNVISVINHYIRFVDESFSDKNRWRWPIKEYWARFLADAAEVTLYAKPGTDYNMSNLRRYVLDSCGAGTRTYIQIVGIDRFLAELKEECIISNPKYKELLRLHGLGELKM